MIFHLQDNSYGVPCIWTHNPFADERVLVLQKSQVAQGCWDEVVRLLVGDSHKEERPTWTP